MTWISLVCLLALSSSAFGRSAYGSGYSSVPSGAIFEQPAQQRQFLSTLPVQQDFQVPQKFQSALTSSYGSQMLPKALENIQAYGAQSFGSVPRPSALEQQQLQQQQQQLQQLQIQQQQQFVTPADILCKGQVPETIIPLENGRKFVVCLDEGKGVEQQCPKGLIFHATSRRCERKLGALENPCASQPCRNGGQCVATENSYQCQCTPGYDGKTCELDARVCQTQQPCGQAPDARCQSFRAGAALTHVCILQDGLAYGLTAQQASPSPCQGVDGPQALTVSDKGFIMCDGERMFVESCPGGTIWDDLNKACVWPDMQGATSSFPTEQPQQIPQQSYGKQRQMINKSAYGAQQTIPRTFEQPRYTQSFGVPQTIPRAFDLNSVQQQIPQQIQYGQQQIKPATFQQTLPIQQDSAPMKQTAGY